MLHIYSTASSILRYPPLTANFVIHGLPNMDDLVVIANVGGVRATATHKHMEFFLILNVSASPSPSPYIPRRAACTPTSNFLSTLSRDPLPRDHRRR